MLASCCFFKCSSGLTRDKDMQLRSENLPRAYFRKYLYVLVSPKTSTCNYVQFLLHAAAKFQKYLHVLVSPETRTYNYVHQISGSQISKIWFANHFLDFGHADIGWAQYLHVLVSPETRTCKYFLTRFPGKSETSSLLKMNTQYQNYKPRYAIISWNPFQKIFACPSLR